MQQDQMIALRRKQQSVAVPLLVVYLVAAAARFLLGLAASQNPFVMPDEALYANLARSIATGGGIALHNQPVTYTNLLYPLLLAPIYGLAAPGIQFRLIQLLNCLLMNLALFPAFHIARSFTQSKKKAWGIALLSILLPDLLLTTRIMTEAVVYPLFLLTVQLMFQKFERKGSVTAQAVVTGVSAFLLAQAKGGMAALALVFFGMLLFDGLKLKRRGDIRYGLIFLGTFVGLTALTYLGLLLAGMNFATPSIYQTQTQLPGLTHLKQTLPGMLLYAFFIPVAFGIFPLLLPASNIGSYSPAKRRQIALTLLSLALVAAGACYLFFDTETIGNFYQGRIHIRYVFMFLPLFLSFVFAPALDGARPNGKLVCALGFLLAMTVTVGFGAELSNRRYPVDALLLSWITWDDAALNMKLLSQIAAVTFSAAMLWLLARRGWDGRSKALMAVCMVLGLFANNLLGYGLNSYNNTAALASDARQAARALNGKATLLAPDSGIYFDNTLSVLDCAMKQAPYSMKLEDLCAQLGPYGQLQQTVPPKYWTERPTKALPKIDRLVMNASAFNRVVLAEGATVDPTGNSYFGVVTPPADGRLFHSALVGLDGQNKPTAEAKLYVFDKAMLSKEKLTVYLQVRTVDPAALVLSDGAQGFRFNLTQTNDWITCDFDIPAGCQKLPISIQTGTNAPEILTYRVQ